MSRFIGIAFLIGGMMLIIFGINASDAFVSDISRLFAGLPADKAAWMLIAGFGSSILGLFYTLRTAHSG